MTANLYSLRDMIADFYGQPFVCQNDTAAVRAVEQQVNRGTGMLGEYPEHFQLLRVGEWNDNTGAITPCVPDLVANCSQVKKLVDIVSPDLPEGN